MISRLRLLCFLFVAIYLVLVIFAFEHVCEVFSAVEGYQCKGSGYYDYIVGFFLLLILALNIPIVGQSYSACMLWLLYYFHVVPSVLFFSRINAQPFTETIFFVVMIFFSYLILVYAARLKLARVGLLYFKGGVNNWLLFFVLVFFVYVIVGRLGFNFNPPAIDDVYGVRAEYKARLTPLVSYIAILTGYFLSPVFVVLSVAMWSRGNRGAAVGFLCIAAFLSYLIYSSAGFKSVAFMPIVTFCSCVLFSRVVNIGFLLNCMFLLLLLFAWLLFSVFDISIILEHWIRRSLIVPGMNVAYFYDYAVNYGFSPNVSPPRVISNTYFGTDGSANAGFIGDGIVRFGVGFFWVSVLLLFVFVKLPDIVFGRLSGPYMPALFISIAYALSNSSMTTVFLTYGFLPLLVFVYFYRGVLVK